MKWNRAKRIIIKLINKRIQFLSFDANAARYYSQPTPHQLHCIKERKELYEVLDLLNELLPLDRL
jgi:hypothetical protein